MAYQNKKLSINGQPVEMTKMDDYLHPERLYYFGAVTAKIGGVEHRLLNDDGCPAFIPDAGRFLHRENCPTMPQALICKVPPGHYFMRWATIAITAVTVVPGGSCRRKHCRQGILHLVELQRLRSHWSFRAGGWRKASTRRSTFRADFLGHRHRAGCRARHEGRADGHRNYKIVKKGIKVAAQPNRLGDPRWPDIRKSFDKFAEVDHIDDFWQTWKFPRTGKGCDRICRTKSAFRCSPTSALLIDYQGIIGSVGMNGAVDCRQVGYSPMDTAFEPR